MFKKTLISLAVASSLGLTGCFSGSNSGGNDNPKPQYAGDALNTTYPLFNPAKRQIPTPTDLSFSGSLDGTFKLDLTADSSPVEIALDSLSGASTVDPITIKTSGQIDKSSLKPNQNIFLIPVKYASGDPIQGLSNQEPPTVDLAKVAKTNFIVDVIDVDDSTAIRITPTEPLAPNTRYVVGITKGVKDGSGKSIGQDPVYANVTGEGTETDPNFGLVNAALAPIRSLVNKFWEPTVSGFAAAISNGANKLSANDIAMSYSFTTSNDIMVTRYIAYPENWLRDQLEGFVRVSTAKKVVGAALFASGQDLEEAAPSPLTGFQKWDLNRDGSIDSKDFDVNGDGSVSTADFLFVNTSPANFGYKDVEAAVQGALATFEPSTALNNAALAPCDTPNSQTGNYEYGPLGSFEDQFACVAAGLGAAIDQALAGQGIEIAEPDSRAITVGASAPAQTKSAILATVPGSEFVAVSESSITLPYYLGLPSNVNGAPIQTQAWKADTTFAAALNQQFAQAGLVIPQGAGLSEVVNAIFPFPAAEGDTEVPMLVLHPDFSTAAFAGSPLENATLSTPGAITDVVIFQHGITTDRSAALAFGSALVASGIQQNKRIAVVAIDQPLHGIAPATLEDKEELSATLLMSLNPGLTELQIQQLTALILAGDAPTLAGALFQTQTPTQEQVGQAAVLIGTVDNAGSTIPGLAPQSTATGYDANGINERHFGWASNSDFDRTLPVGQGNLPWAPMQFNPAPEVEEPGASGDLFINLGNFLNSRDNLRQGVLDLLNLRASLPVEVGAFANAKFHFVGHSLGTINGNAFVVAANSGDREDLKIENSHLMTPASGVVRMLENSPSFAPTILAGLKQTDSELTQASNNLQSFFTVFQAAIDTVDPINMVDELQGSNTLISQVDGDRTTINAAFDFYIEGSGTNWEAGYKPFVTDALQVVGLNIDSQSPAPLAGSEPLAAWIAAGSFAEGLPAITRYAEGTHGTPVLPLAEATEAPNFAEFEFDFLKDRTLALTETQVVSTANASLMFSGLVGQTLQMILQSSAPQQP
ncbi:Ig-like domain-containing protein [Marinobacter sp.]|uniref:Ig-like domain-containing protein n=1 Tax=Marinobacter sp. TaxID=50741 RepID=UPI00258C5DF7|nr:Ig-like domain-containing protein [Marinobacter sp.]MCW9009951.1 Ig-like domain-containing protein [Marinobacter sp.]